MGLDMYLEGEKFIWTDWKNPENNLKEDGFKITKKILELGYWRKHPDLHGFVVNSFAKGKDNCEKIFLSIDDLNKILEAIKKDSLPKTTGVFFGTSLPKYKEESIEIILKVIKWLEQKEKGILRSVYYRASW